MNILFIIEARILMLVKMVMYSPLIVLTIVLSRMVAIFGACSPVSFKHVYLWYLF